MPTLIAAVFNGENNDPVIWKCSDCEEAFSHDRMGKATISELHKINGQFIVHCQQKHPGGAVIGIAVPKAHEDASQAAARIVREATEGK